VSETCKTCRFWDKHPMPDSFEGECHRFPPVLCQNAKHPLDCADFTTPITAEHFHCGEHQPLPVEPQNVTSTGDIRYA